MDAVRREREGERHCPALQYQLRTAVAPGSFICHRFLPLALFLLSFLYLCLFRHVTALEPDEGIILQGAQRILAGQVVYRDFFSFYTPGSYYALAGIFRIFGSSLGVARVALAGVGALLSVLTYLLALRVSSRSMALTLAVLGTLTTLPYRFLVLHNWDSTLWACLALYAAVRLLENPTRKWAFGVGSLASLTVLFEQSKGAGLCLGLGMGALAIFIVRRRSPLNGPQWLWMAAGFVWPLALTFAWFASQHSTAVMLADWFWPLGHYSRANHVPYGYQNWSEASRHLLFETGSLFERAIKLLAIGPLLWIPFLPFAAVGFFGRAMLRAWRGQEPDAKRDASILISACMVGLWLSVLVTRTDIIHFMYLQPLNCVLLAWILDSAEWQGRLRRFVQPWLAAYVIAALFLLGMIPLAGVGAAHNQVVTRRGILTTNGKDTVIEYVQAHVPSGSKILVYPYLPLYYFATATFSPSRYDYFQPGMHTQEQAEEIIEQLASQRVGVVLFETNFADKIPHAWPGTLPSTVAQDPVADYIRMNYRSCADLMSPVKWQFAFMVRKDLPCN